MKVCSSCLVPCSRTTLRASTRRYLSVSGSTRASNPYPFPNTPDPTPYQIFHLMPDASPVDVKQRYYELVRLYHPDSTLSRSREPDAARRHAHFSAITRAYLCLQKRRTGEGIDADLSERTINPWRRTQSMRKRRYEEPRFMDDRWKDRFILGILGLSFVSVAAQTIMVRRRRFQGLSEHLHTNEAMPLNWKPSERSSDEDVLKLRRPKQ